MNEQNSLESLQDIRRMMDRSSRFISLSGFSGISAGICALIGAFFAYGYIYGHKPLYINESNDEGIAGLSEPADIFNTYLFWIAAATLVAAIGSAFIFTMIRSRRDKVSIWNGAARRLTIAVAVPLIAGGIFLLEFGYYLPELLGPGCLIFYGLALINASRYTLQEIKYLGHCELLLGLISIFTIGIDLYFWAFGFGILHIAYGIYMWLKYEKKEAGA